MTSTRVTGPGWGSDRAGPRFPRVRRWIVGGTLTVLCLTVLHVVWGLFHLREPILEGRPLRNWTAELVLGTGLEPERAREVLQDHRAVATPYLNRFLVSSSSDPELMDRWIGALPRGWKRWLHRHRNPYQEVIERVHAARALGEIEPPDEPTLEALTRGLWDPESRVQEACLNALWGWRPEGGDRIAVVLSALPSTVKWQAVARFEPGHPDVERAGPALLAELRRLDHAHEGLSLGRALGRYGPSILSMAWEALDGGDAIATENTVAALTLACEQNHAFWRAFLDTLTEQPASARRIGLEVVARTTLYPVRQAVLLADRVSDPDPAVRVRAAELLLERPGNVTRAIPVLMGALESADPDVRRLGADTLGRLGAAVEPGLDKK